MAVSWGFTMLLVVTLVALFTFSQPLFQRTLPETVEEQTQTDLEIVVSQAAAAVAPRHYPFTSKRNLPSSDESGLKSKSTKVAWSWNHILRRGASPRTRRTRKLIDRQPRASLPRRSFISRKSVLASFQSDRMVPTGPNPLHNSNRSQVIFP